MPCLTTHIYKYKDGKLPSNRARLPVGQGDLSQAEVADNAYNSRNT